MLVPNFAILDENFRTIRFSYNFSMAHNFGRVSCPLPPLPLPRVLRAIREQSVVVALGLPQNFYKSSRGSL